MQLLTLCKSKSYHIIGAIAVVGVDGLVHQSHKVQDLLSSPQCRGEVVTGGGAHIVSRGYLHRSLRQLREGFKKNF